jgi:peptidoglycan/xylan/chitin deacetylase (PgdA/CDA1 family)
VAKYFLGPAGGMTSRAIILALACALAPMGARAAVVHELPTSDRVVALTFDACQAVTPAHLDHGISDYLTGRRIPFTVFMGGRFARDNAKDVKALAAFDFVEIENHTWSHFNHMTRLSDEMVRLEVTRAEDEIREVSGRQTVFFRFPAGDYDARTLGIVEGLGYRVVHWRWPVGDPDASLGANQMVRDVLRQTRPGDILIFHINGRGVHTAQALPRIVDGLTAEGYRFVTVNAYLTANRVAAHRAGSP